jgi:aerobic carbon-monoxide dehydrogenase small subunit
MTPVALTVNGRKVQALVEPRTHLGDFLREQLRLTGTHLGCEHGVCGACTVLLDGVPVRSCLTYAVTCEGQEVRTIEGFESDATMQALRDAFSREHGLQCGFCTPGMLIASRDIVQRLPGTDEQRIRVELSGNLCRCTGYAGIVRAVRKVAEAGPAAAAAVAAASPPRPATFSPVEVARAPKAVAAVVEEAAPRKGWTRFEESFLLRKPPALVWESFADLPLVASCLPGAELTEHDARSVKGRMGVKMGPINAAFGGSAVIERDDATLSGVIRGAGADRGTGSRTKGDVTYRLSPELEGTATRVSVVVEYSLQGTLAQFSRTSLAQELGRRLVGEFAGNLDARLGGGAAPAASQPASLNAGALLWSWLKDKLKRLFGGA